MKTKLTHLLACAGEECGEIQQVVGKILRFGLFDTNDGKKKNTNWVEFRKEMHDLVAVYQMICDEIDRADTIDKKLLEKKKRRVIKYMGYSKKVGQLET